MTRAWDVRQKQNGTEWDCLTAIMTLPSLFNVQEIIIKTFSARVYCKHISTITTAKIFKKCVWLLFVSSQGSNASIHMKVNIFDPKWLTKRPKEGPVSQGSLLQAGYHVKDSICDGSPNGSLRRPLGHRTFGSTPNSSPSLKKLDSFDQSTTPIGESLQHDSEAARGGDSWDQQTIYQVWIARNDRFSHRKEEKRKPR